jgi:hypothetical protein
MTEIECEKCGKCCYWIVKDKIVRCKFLRVQESGETRCIRYYNRLGTPLGKGIKCGFRKDAPFNFEGCPYNVLYPEKPMFPKL